MVSKGLGNMSMTVVTKIEVQGCVYADLVMRCCGLTCWSASPPAELQPVLVLTFNHQ